MTGTNWRHRSECRDEDGDLFFPIGTSGLALLQAEQAKAVCRRCVVVDECLTWALESGQEWGVAGGMSEAERRAIKRRGGLRVRLADAVPATRVCDRCADVFEVPATNAAAEVCTRCVDKATAELARSKKKSTAGAR